VFFFSSRRRHTRFSRDWSSDVCSSDLRTLEERDIRFVRLWFTDVLGTLKSVSVAPAELEAAFAEGIGFDGSSIEGFARVHESDMIAMPDPTTFQVFPYETSRPDSSGSGG